MEGDQRDLFEGETQRIIREQREYLRKVQGVVARLTPKEACYATGAGRAAMENTLAMRGFKKPPSIAWTLHLVRADPDHEVLHVLADEVNCVVTEAKDARTDNQVVAETRAYLQRMGPLGMQILKDLGLANRGL